MDEKTFEARLSEMETRLEAKEAEYKAELEAKDTELESLNAELADFKAEEEKRKAAEAEAFELEAQNAVAKLEQKGKSKPASHDSMVALYHKDKELFMEMAKMLDSEFESEEVEGEPVDRPEPTAISQEKEGVVAMLRAQGYDDERIEHWLKLKQEEEGE